MNRDVAKRRTVEFIRERKAAKHGTHSMKESDVKPLTPSTHYARSAECDSRECDLYCVLATPMNEHRFPPIHPEHYLLTVEAIAPIFPERGKAASIPAM